MDLSDPTVRRDTITALFNEEMARVSRQFRAAPAAALTPLYKPGDTWQGDLSTVDPEQLRLALRAIAEGLADPSSPRLSVSAGTVAAAKAASSCHYLWFC